MQVKRDRDSFVRTDKYVQKPVSIEWTTATLINDWTKSIYYVSGSLSEFIFRNLFFIIKQHWSWSLSYYYHRLSVKIKDKHTSSISVNVDIDCSFSFWNCENIDTIIPQLSMEKTCKRKTNNGEIFSLCFFFCLDYILSNQIWNIYHILDMK